MEAQTKNLEVVVKLKHLDYSHISGKESSVNPRVWLKWAELCRYWIRIMLEEIDENIFKEKTLFLRWQQFEVTDALKKFNKRQVKDMVNNAFSIYSTIADVGNTSMIQQFKVVLTSTNELLGCGLAQLIYVDVYTHKPISFPVKVKSYVNKELSKNNFVRDLQIKMCITRYIIPDEAFPFSLELFVPYTGIDHNGHLNQSCYLNLMLDSLEIALTKNAFKNMSNTLLNLEMEKYSFLYIKECFSGDKLSIKIWQNLNNDFLFHFHAHTEGGLVHQCEILFTWKIIMSKM